MGLRLTRARSTRTIEELGQWLVAAAPDGAAVQVAVAAAQGSNRGDGGWCRKAAVTLAQCSGDAGPARARLEVAQGSGINWGRGIEMKSFDPPPWFK